MEVRNLKRLTENQTNKTREKAWKKQVNRIQFTWYVTYSMPKEKNYSPKIFNNITKCTQNSESSDDKAQVIESIQGSKQAKKAKSTDGDSRVKANKEMTD